MIKYNYCGMRNDVWKNLGEEEAKRRIKMYQDSMDEGIKEGQANIAMALRACLNKDD